MSWKLLPFLILPGEQNMALDAWLLRRSLEQGETHLRFYLWTRPALSLGRSQTGGEIADIEFCRANGIDVVRRPTGGRAVLHHRELTYAVTGRFGRDGFPSNVQETYRAICEGLCLGLNAMSVPALIWEGTSDQRLPTPKTPLPCFATPVPGEIAAGGRKLVGSAMRADGAGFLQHGSILLDIDPVLQKGAQRDKSDCPAACIVEWRNPLPSWGEILAALSKGIALRFKTGPMEPVGLSMQDWIEIRHWAEGCGVIHT
jgi:lipoate-protein ligase A